MSKKPRKKKYAPEGQPDVTDWVALNPDQARAHELLAEGNPKAYAAPGGVATPIHGRDLSK